MITIPVSRTTTTGHHDPSDATGTPDETGTAVDEGTGTLVTEGRGVADVARTVGVTVGVRVVACQGGRGMS
jgi:hypothetical protein